MQTLVTVAPFMAFMATNIACCRIGQKMAARRRRSVKFWLWATAFTGAAPLALLVTLPPKRVIA